MRCFAVLAAIIIFAHTALTAGTDDHARLHEALASGNDQAAIALLKEMSARDAAAFELNNYPYLLARLLERSGNISAALAAYQLTADSNSILREYALWHIAKIARQSGNLLLERTTLSQLIAFYPKSLLADAARERNARSYYESGNYELAVKNLNDRLALLAASSTLPKFRGESSIAREDRLLLARAYLAVGNKQAARDNFTQLVERSADPSQPDDIALEAAKGLDTIDLAPDQAGKIVPKLSDTEHLRRAQIYQFNRDFFDARLHFQAIINDHPASGIVPDAIFQIGRGFTQLADFPEAVRWYERTQEQFPDHPASRDALLQAASAYARLGKHREAISRYESFIEKYPDDERLQRAYLNIIDVLRDQGHDTEAMKWSEKTQEVFRGRPAEAVAIFGTARIRLSKNEWEATIADIDRLLQLPDLASASPGGTNRPELKMLRALSLEGLGRYGEAIDEYLSITDGRAEYYGGRATERLLAMHAVPAAKNALVEKMAALRRSADSGDPDSRRTGVQALLRLTPDAGPREKLLEELKKIYTLLPAYRNLRPFKFVELGGRGVISDEKGRPKADGIHALAANELLFLGLYDEAAPEADAALREKGVVKSASTDEECSLAVLYERGDLAYRAVAFAEPLFRGVPADFQPELMPAEYADLLYPAPYQRSLLNHAAPRHVDPRFLLSIMRQESRYRPDVKSYAAARGLMQFISTTSEKVARDLKRIDFRQSELYDPDTAVLFGSQYAADLFLLFPNQPQAVAASYNGGEDNMRRWLRRSSSSDPDRYVSEIAFAQSKDYVYKVMATYRLYRLWRNEDLKKK